MDYFNRVAISSPRILASESGRFSSVRTQGCFWNETALRLDIKDDATRFFFFRHGKSRKITYTKRHADASLFSDDGAPLPPLLIGDDDDATILLRKFVETMDFYPETATSGMIK